MAYTTINKSTDYFNTKLWTGTGSSGAKGITGVGFQPDFLWIKNRSAGQEHWLADAVRGTTKFLESNSSNAESSDGATGLASFDSDGFTLGTGSNRTNQSGSNMVAWNWKAGGTGSSNSDGSVTSTVSANTTAGFSIVQWTSGGNTTVGHGLGVAPSLIFVKATSETANWIVGSSALGWGNRLKLNTTDSSSSSSAFQSTTPTSSVFSENYSSGSKTKIAYCFAEKTGYSKFGSYEGNNHSSNNTFIYTGFKPQFLIIRNADATADWVIQDNKRNPINPREDVLLANSSVAEQDWSSYPIDLLSNGFKIRNNGQGSGTSHTFIYMAFGQSLVGSNNVPCTAR